jgi:protein-tyrosine-phosphatase
MNNSSKPRKRRILTVCYGNFHRSRTAEWLLHKNYNVESCGVWSGAVKPIDRRLVEFADQIVVMEDYMADEIAYRYPKAKNKITVLGVADTGICSELVLELSDKLQAEGFRTLGITDVDQAVQECREWVNERIRDHSPFFAELS